MSPAANRLDAAGVYFDSRRLSPSMRFTVLILMLVGAPLAGDAPKSRPAREALKPLNVLVGSWKGTGTPEGSLEERQKGHWIETDSWGWQFKGDDAWLMVTFDKGKYFARGELRPRTDADGFELTLTTVGKEKLTYAGTLNGKQLVFERSIKDAKQVERLTFSLLHDNRVTYRLDTKPEGGTTFTRKYLVGLTKEGE